MKHVLRGLLIIIVSTFVFTRCVQTSSVESQNGNEFIELKVSEGSGLYNPLKIGERVLIDAINNSKEEIWFPPDFNVQLFAQIDDKWTPVENNVNYGEEEIILIPNNPSDPMNILFSVATVFLFPNLFDSNVPIKMRLTVTGFIVENDITTNESVNAELEFVLSP